jgi:hypothetical protein
MAKFLSSRAGLSGLSLRSQWIVEEGGLSSGKPRLWTGNCLDLRLVYMYQDNMQIVERVQTGVRMERRTLKVLKALAESLDLSLGDLLEGIVLHAFEGKVPFGEKTRTQIDLLKQVYGLTLTAADAHRLAEADVLS